MATARRFFETAIRCSDKGLAVPSVTAAETLRWEHRWAALDHHSAGADSAAAVS